MEPIGTRVDTLFGTSDVGTGNLGLLPKWRAWTNYPSQKLNVKLFGKVGKANKGG